MKVRFIGPLGKVTGSCTWLRDAGRGWNFLVDCGMQQGEHTAAQWNAGDWPFEPAELGFIVLTHAHIDHCGLIPLLYQRGFRGLVYCTKETAEIAEILLNDAARLSGAFSADDVAAIRWHEPTRAPLFGHYHPVDQNLFLQFVRTGHVIGAVSVAVYWGAQGPAQRSIIFSGDLGPNAEDRESLPFLRHRMNSGSNTFAVIESTYGSTLRTEEENDPEWRRGQLQILLDRTLERRGSLIIPAFSLGRTQDVLFDLHWLVAQSPSRYGEIEFYLDSPTAQKMAPIVMKALHRTESNGRNGKVRPLWLGKQMFRWFGLDDRNPEHVQRALGICAATLGVVRTATTQTEAPGNALSRAWRPVLRAVDCRKRTAKVTRNKASVFVVSSGSGDGGPAAFWLPELLASPDTTVALTGYCTPSSIGGRLMSLSAVTPNERRHLIGRLEWPDGPVVPLSGIGAHITMLKGYSAHADQKGLLDWLFSQYGGRERRAGETLFIQHGGGVQREALADAVRHRAKIGGMQMNVLLPVDPSEWFDLNTDGRIMEREQQRQFLAAEIERMQKEFAELAP